MRKICSKCKKEKDVTEFRKDKYRPDGYTCQCKTCIKNRHTNVCKQCGKLFSAEVKGQDYCSYTCRGKANEKQVVFNCEYCNKETSQAECYYNMAKHHYCSDECRLNSKKHYKTGKDNPKWKRIVCKCDYCGIEIEKKEREYKISEYHYCSYECMGKHKSIIHVGENNGNWKGNRIKFNCDICGKETEQPYHQYHSSKNHYCSYACLGKANAINNKGEKSPVYNPNLTDEERISKRDYSEYIAWRKAVYEKDEYTCKYCNKQGGDKVAHHLDGYDNFHDKRTDINNGATLCIECHKDFHMKYGYGNNTKEQFLEWINEKVSE